MLLDANITSMIDLKPVTVRLPQEDLLIAEREAEALGVGVGVYLRILVRQGLRKDERASKRADALLNFSRAMSAAVNAKDYNEKDIAAMTKQARKKVATKRRKSQASN